MTSDSPDGQPVTTEATGSAEHIAWMVLRGRLAADTRGREILAQLAAAPETGADRLRQYLFTEAAPAGLSTVVTGGTVDRLVNIARADVVNIAAAAPVITPRQLPPMVADFTDRVEVVERLVQLASTPDPGTRLLLIVGSAGVGKTTLSVSVAHRLADAFPDAQLYVDLHGVDVRPADPHAVLASFLGALGTEPRRIPETTEERSALFRAVLSSRRALLLLDNAGGAQQVRPLLPGADSVVLLTSREMLSDLEGVQRLSLDVLAPQDATTLMMRILGEERAAERDSVEALAVTCGNLPLALRIAASKLATRPHWRVHQLVSRLNDNGRRLAELELGDLNVRASFSLSYDGLDEEQRRCFRWSALTPGPTFSPWAVGGILGIDVDRASELLDQLLELHLVEYAGEGPAGWPRFHFLDLLRLFAEERTKTEDSQEDQRAAIERCLGAYLTIAARGLQLQSPQSKRDPEPGRARRWPLPADLVDALLGDPYDWFTAEHAALVAGIRKAHDLGLWACTYELVEAMHYYLRVRGHVDDWRATTELALASARIAGDRRAEAWTLRNLGNALQDEARFVDSTRCFEEASTLFGELGSSLGEAAARCALGETRLVQGHFGVARDDFEHCLPGWAAAGDSVGVAYTEDNLAFLEWCAGDLVRAAAHFDRSLEMFRELGDMFGEAHSLRRSVDVAVEQGRLDEAEQDLARCVELFQEVGSVPGEAWSAIGSSRVALKRGHVEFAIEQASRAVRVFQEQGDRRAAAHAMVQVCEALLAGGRTADATALASEAQRELQELGDDFGSAMAMHQHGRCLAAAGQVDAAGALLQKACVAYEQLPAELFAARARQDRATLRPA